MNEGFRRFLVLLVVFLLAFAAVFAFRRVQQGEGLFSFLKFGKGKEKQQFAPESYTLPEEPALDPGDVKWLVRLNQEYAKLTEAVVPSVVSLHTEGTKRQLLRDLFGRVYEHRYPVSGIGSGVIVSKEGHVVTNQHVTDGKQAIRVTLHDGKSYEAILIGEDPALDIAVLRIQAKKREFAPLKFGDSDRVRRGDLAFAIGNPFGLGETITQGIISAKERSLSDTQRDLFQTDAAINPGNSGGPLVNIFGEIIGINVAIYSPDTEARGFVGVGFSIPSNDVFDAFTQILERGRPVRGYLGVQVLDWEPWSRAETKYSGEQGSFIYDVIENSPAAKAGLQAFDVIVTYDKRKVESRLHFISLIQRTPIGKEVVMEVWRKGEMINLGATVVDAAEAHLDGREEPANRTANEEEIAQAIGLTVGRLNPLQRMRGGKGVMISGVRRDSQAFKAGLLPGDLVLAVNKISCNTPNEFYARLIASAAVQDTSIVVQRGNGTALVTFEKVDRPEAAPTPER